MAAITNPAPARSLWGSLRRGHGRRRTADLANPQQEVKRLDDRLTTERAATASLTHDLTQAAIRITALETEQEEDAEFIVALRARLAGTCRDLHQTAFTLGEVGVLLEKEKTAHARTQELLDIAVRANESNANAETVVTDVSVLRLPQADEYVDLPERGPEFAPYTRTAGPKVMPLNQSPMAGAR